MKKSYKILDMHCANCAMKLESIEDELPGIQRIDASYHKQQMVVEFDDKQVSEAQILAAVEKKGYHPQVG